MTDSLSYVKLYELDFYKDLFRIPRTKEDLQIIWDCDERTVRRNVAELQKNLNIVNLQDGRGWFIPDKTEEILAFAKQEYSRGIKNIAKAYKMFKRCNVDGQTDLEDIFSEIRKEVM